jgi:glycosyltransferase involved in cell wall biosynthesis
VAALTGPGRPVRHVCLISIEMYSERRVGGFGRATRTIGRELVRRGLQVTAVVPRRGDEFPDEYERDGVRVLQFNPRRPWTAVGLFRRISADVYHSQDTSLGTRLALYARPQSRHVITFRDPMDEHDWDIETHYSGHGRFGWQMYRSFVDGRLVATAVARADALYCAAEFLRAKVARKYGLSTLPGFLPTPVHIPATVEKARKPTVCYVGRWEGRKRPELFLELARAIPHVDFIAVGGAQDPGRDALLRQTYANCPNLEMTGFLDQFQTDRLYRILEKSWAIVNTSAREGLPNAFLEACAHQCAVLSFSDPDQFASRFGAVASDREGGLRQGLEWLLTGDRWRECGVRGQEFVAGTFATDRAIDAHLDAYSPL